MQPTRSRPLRASAAYSALALLVGAMLTIPGLVSAQDGRLAAATAIGVRASAVRSARDDDNRNKPKRRRGARRSARRATKSAAAAAPARHTAPRSVGALTSDLSAMLADGVRSGRWGVMVVSLTRGDTLYSYDASVLLQPASNMKLFTAALALDQFGPSHQFSTDVLRDGIVTPDGTLHGNLILRGGGDPALASRYVRDGVSAPMDRLAEFVASRGIKRVRGSVVADASAFDAQRIPEGWQSRYLAASYAARVSALSLNDNLVWVVVHPGVSSKESAEVFLDPGADIALTGQVRTVGGSRGARVVARTTPDGGIAVSGWIGSRAGERRYGLVVEDPAVLAAGAFRRALTARGIAVDGGTVFGRTPPKATLVGMLPSPPLERLLSVMNRESINHYAELIFRNVARTGAYGGIGSAAAANRQLQQFMTGKVGATPGSVHAADGSGLSTLDRATPRTLVQLLAYAHRAPWSDAFHASLPVAGESELLRHRMKYTPAQGNLHAKTGTTDSVISLSGYVTAQDGELLAFAFVYNGTDRWNAKTTIDRIGATLAAFSRD